MNQYNAIIIDDEVNVRHTLELLIQQNCPEIRLCGSAGSAEAGRRLLINKEVQVIFLDISMPNENGFDFITTIPREKYAVIFTTAYEEYALKAIKASAIDYLLKPINPEELKDAVAKATFYLSLRTQKNDIQKIYNESMENLLNQIKLSGTPVSKITVIEKYGFRIVETDTIRYLEADGNYSVIHLSGLEKVVAAKTMADFEKILDMSVFFRIHKSCIINLRFLKGFSSFQGFYVFMDDDTKLPLSRRRFLEFREQIGLLSKSLD